MSNQQITVASLSTIPFLAERGELAQMVITYIIDGVHHSVACNRFEVTSVCEVNAMDARRADLSASKTDAAA